MAAGDAAASAYLHALADATQVAHILRASAHTLRVLELAPEGEPSSPSEIAELASPQVIDVCGFVRLVAGFLQRSVAVLLPRSRRTGCR